MARKSTSSAPPAVERSFEVFGTVRDAYPRPLKGAHVEVVDRLLRSERRLGKRTHTNDAGAYRVSYEASDLEPPDRGAADIQVRIFGRDDKLLTQSSIYYNAAASLRVDIDLAPIPYPGPSEFDQVLEGVRSVAGKVPLSKLTQDESHQDISFLTGKTGLMQAEVSALVMAFRFEKSTGVAAVAYYALLRQGPAQKGMVQPAGSAPSLSFDDQATQAFAALMQQPIAALMSGIQAAIA